MGLSQVKDGDWFVLVINLVLCIGVCVYLWFVSVKFGGLFDFEEVVEVIMKMVEILVGFI